MSESKKAKDLVKKIETHDKNRRKDSDDEIKELRELVALIHKMGLIVKSRDWFTFRNEVLKWKDVFEELEKRWTHKTLFQNIQPLIKRITNFLEKVHESEKEPSPKVRFFLHSMQPTPYGVTFEALIHDLINKINQDYGKLVYEMKIEQS